MKPDTRGVGGAGNRLANDLRRFHARLGDQPAILGVVSTVDASPGQIDDSDAPYHNLKAYLMMTRHPEKADPGFLAAILAARWPQGGAAGDEQKKLAAAQFWFYASERKENFCPARPDDDAP